MKVKKYKFTEGSRWKVDPDLAGKAIEKIAAKNNTEITPQMVLNVAKNKRSHLHACFNWDDKKAANSYRLWQARKLLSSLTVEIIFDEPKQVRAFINVSTSAKTQAYFSVSNISKDETKRQMVIKDVQRRLKQASEQLYIYENLQPISIGINELAEQLN